MRTFAFLCTLAAAAAQLDDEVSLLQVEALQEPFKFKHSAHEMSKGTLGRLADSMAEDMARGNSPGAPTKTGPTLKVAPGGGESGAPTESLPAVHASIGASEAIGAGPEAPTSIGTDDDDDEGTLDR